MLSLDHKLELGMKKGRFAAAFERLKNDFDQLVHKLRQNETVGPFFVLMSVPMLD